MKVSYIMYMEGTYNIGYLGCAHLGHSVTKCLQMAMQTLKV